MTLRPDVLAPIDIASTARRVGAYVWVCSRLFETTGSWSIAEGEPANKRIWFGVSRRFAWQAGQFHERLPKLREVDRSLLVGSPGPGSTSRLQSLESICQPDDRRRALGSVIGDLDHSLAQHVAKAEPLRDGPLLRTIERVRNDLANLVREFELESVVAPNRQSLNEFYEDFLADVAK